MNNRESAIVVIREEASERGKYLIRCEGGLRNGRGDFKRGIG
jgi:hypothetical protein